MQQIAINMIGILLFMIRVYLHLQEVELNNTHLPYILHLLASRHSVCEQLFEITVH